MTHRSQAVATALREQVFLTDGGLETILIFKNGFELPHFAAFPLLSTTRGRSALRDYYRKFMDIAVQFDTGFILDSPTWRASKDWGVLLGYSQSELALMNLKAIELLVELRDEFRGSRPCLISGNIGPRGDGYRIDNEMTAEESEDYHRQQVEAFEAAGVDMLSAITLTHAAEAQGIARLAAGFGLPLALSITVETDGRLPSGQSLGDAINQVDDDVPPTYFMINCAHPDHYRNAVESGKPWVQRIWGLRSNASRLSHTELDESDALDSGCPAELGELHGQVLQLLPSLRVLGGCCGTDSDHIREIASACLSRMRRY